MIQIFRHPFLNSDIIQIKEKYDDDTLVEFREFYKNGKTKTHIYKLENSNILLESSEFYKNGSLKFSVSRRENIYVCKQFLINSEFKSASISSDIGREGEEIVAHYRLKKRTKN